MSPEEAFITLLGSLSLVTFKAQCKFIFLEFCKSGVSAQVSLG